MTIAAANGGRQRTAADGLPQATRAAALVSRAATWLRDEEARSRAEACQRGCLARFVAESCLTDQAGGARPARARRGGQTAGADQSGADGKLAGRCILAVLIAPDCLTHGHWLQASAVLVLRNTATVSGSYLSPKTQFPQVIVSQCAVRNPYCTYFNVSSSESAGGKTAPSEAKSSLSGSTFPVNRS